MYFFHLMGLHHEFLKKTRWTSQPVPWCCAILWTSHDCSHQTDHRSSEMNRQPCEVCIKWVKITQNTYTKRPLYSCPWNTACWNTATLYLTEIIFFIFNSFWVWLGFPKMLPHFPIYLNPTFFHKHPHCLQRRIWHISRILHVFIKNDFQELS